MALERKLVRSPRRLLLRFLSVLLHLSRSRGRAYCSWSSQAVKLRLRHFVRLMWKSKREILWQKSLFTYAATASLVSGRLADYCEVQPEFEALVEQLWEKIFPRLL